MLRCARDTVMTAQPRSLAEPREGVGSEVEMTLQRRFRRCPAGAVAYVFNHVAGRRGWAWYLRGALKAVEHAPDRSGGENASAAAA